MQRPLLRRVNAVGVTPRRAAVRIDAARRHNSTAAAVAIDHRTVSGAPAHLHLSAAERIAANESAAAALRSWLRDSRVLTVISGAGISTASGIPDYRSPGRPPHRPVQHAQFMTSPAIRQRYWLRSALGFPKLSQALPNAAHTAVAQAMARGAVSYVITQNVDGLHAKAGAPEHRVLPLHGDIRKVQCMTCGTVSARHDLQPRLIQLNPMLAPFAAADLPAEAEAERAARPDGDAFLSEETMQQMVPRMRVPACAKCAADSAGALPHVHEPADAIGTGAGAGTGTGGATGIAAEAIDFSRVRAATANPSPRERADAAALASAAALVRRGDRPGILKPSVVFFGGSVPAAAAERARDWIAESDSVLCVGTSFATFSAYRLVLQALDQLPAASVPATPAAEALRGRRRVFILNDGPTRADDLLAGPNGPAVAPRVTKASGRAEVVLPLAFASA